MKKITKEILAAAIGASLLSASPALAGNNGQQVGLNNGPARGFAYIHGINQNDQEVTSPTFWFDNNGTGWLYYWWWKGNISITIYNADGTYSGHRECQVPVSQWANWTSG
jgi:hypothetical protein